MVSSALVSTVLMGVLLVLAFVAVARLGRKIERGELDGDASNGRYDEFVAGAGSFVRRPAVWTVAFLAVALTAGLVAVLAVGGFDVPEDSLAGLVGGVLALFGILLGGFLFAGPYYAVRHRGLGNAQGVVAGLTGVGMGFLLLVVIQLTFGLIG